MNRYTFKAKRKDNGEWVYGNVIINPNSTDKVVIVESGVTSYSSTKEAILEFINDYVEVIPETLCQCTSLQDIDGNYIFENDKIRGLRHHNKKHVIIEGFVEYNEFLARYDVSGNYYNGSQLSAFTNVKIIGNQCDKEVE